ncbi:MAG: hypothetical protein MK212_05485 [Saprospiraceae bacterium]|nr:hypothetical protein [Saprospiraceae bacterium]
MFFKVIIIGILGYALYKLFAQPTIDGPASKKEHDTWEMIRDFREFRTQKRQQRNRKEQEYTDYEEID